MPSDHKLVGGGVFLVMVLISVGIAALVLVGLIVALGIIIFIPVVIGLFVRALYRNRKNGGKFSDLVSRTDLAVAGAFVTFTSYIFSALYFIGKMPTGQSRTNALALFITLPMCMFLVGGVVLLLFFTVRKEQQEQREKQDSST